MEIQTEYIVSEMVPPQARTAEQLLAEGKRLLDSGNKPGALANLVMATNLTPQSEAAWLLRAKATSDPQEAVECLEQALAINPQNHAARDELLDLRMHNLQAGARGETDAARNGPAAGIQGTLSRLAEDQFVRLGVLVFFMVFCGFSFLTVAGAFFFMNNGPSANAPAAARSTATRTVEPFQLPPTWTPSPTQVPTRTPIPSPTPSGLSKTSLTVRAGPGTNYPRLGTVPQDSTFTILGRSADGKYLEIAFPDASRPGWVIASSVDLGEVVLDDLEIAAPLPITPVPAAPRAPVVVAPTAKPSNTPSPASPWQYATNFRDCQHSGGTYIEGDVTNQYGEESGAHVTLGTSPGAGVIQTIVTGSDRSPGYYAFILNANGAYPGTFYVWIADAAGKALSDPNAARVTTNAIKNSDDPNSCWQAFVDFARH